MKVPTLLLICCVLFTAKVATQYEDWKLIWEDNFDGDSIDANKWDYEVTAWGGGVSIIT